MRESYKITLVVGLPGSGKSYLAECLTGFVIDDITELTELPSPDYQDDIVIVDVNFCKKSALDKAKHILRKMYPDHDIDVIYFENDPDKARANVARRNDGRKVNELIDLLTKAYHPPKSAIPIYTDA